MHPCANALTISSHFYTGELMTEQSKQALYSKDLQCGWLAWNVIADGHMHLVVTPGECPSMSGATKIAEALCPTVFRIDVYQGEKPDMVYFKFGGKGKWQAMTAKSVEKDSETV
jgi:hypothetical protein